MFLPLAILSLASLAFAGHSDPSEAPAICAEPGSDSTLIAHEDCNKFYKCFQGRPVAISCPDNLLYNPDKEYCDWAQNVQCRDDVKENRAIDDGKEDTGIEEVNENKEEADKICAEEGFDGKLIAHEDCHKFYECAKGKAITLSCPDDLQYNSEKEYCDWSYNVNCDINF